MANDDRVIKILEDVSETCRDGQNGYRDAAEHVTDSNLREFFNKQSLERAGFAGELEQELQRLGKRDPDRSGSATAAMHRAWIDMKTTLGGGDDALLASVEQGEESARKAYERALQDASLPEPIATILRRQEASVAAAHDHVRSLREARAA